MFIFIIIFITTSLKAKSFIFVRTKYLLWTSTFILVVYLVTTRGSLKILTKNLVNFNNNYENLN